MRLLRHHTHQAPPGTAPGTITVDPAAPKPLVDVMSYGPDAEATTIRRQSINSIKELPELPPRHMFRWVHVSGLGDADVLSAIGERFGIHPLALEDIANPVQRPKVELYDNYLFVVTRVPVADGSERPQSELRDRVPKARPAHDGLLVTEQLAICVGPDFVLTFEEYPGDIFEPVRRRLLKGSGRVRTEGVDYLAYAIMDTAIDAFFPLLEQYGEDVADLEDNVIEQPAVNQIARIHDVKRNLLTVRRAIWPQREMLSTLVRDETPFISASTKLFLRDCYDHTIQLLDMLETYREIASGLVDIQLSSQSNRMNEIMKVLTIISTIFIPLSFIAGVYGMNFDTASPWNLPELGWRYGYPAVWLVMLIVAGSLMVWFWRKGWIGGPRKESSAQTKRDD